jgi:hypothetical protein
MLLLIMCAGPSATPTIRPTEAPSRAPSHSAANVLQAAAAVAEGLELFAMAKAIPRLQKFSSASFKLCLHLYYFTCRQADALDFSSQETSFTGQIGRPRGLQVHQPLTLMLHLYRRGAPSRVLFAGKIPHARTIGACFRSVCPGLDS